VEDGRLERLLLAENLGYHKGVIRPTAFRGSEKALHCGMRSLPRWRRLLNRCPTKRKRVQDPKTALWGTGDSYV